jgi:heat shock protein HslJ
MRMIGLLLLATVLVGVTGHQDDAAAEGVIPRMPPSIVGVITSVDPPVVVVEEDPAQSSGSAKARVRVSAQTGIVRHDGTVAGIPALRAGQRARVWFTGPVAESYPVQAAAGVIVVDSGGAAAVQERHEAQLMAIPGVVGVGVGDRNGAEAVVVFVEEKTAEIEQSIPGTLDGHPVVVEVNGPTGALDLPGSRWRLQGWAASSLEPSRFTITAEFSKSQISGTSAVNSYGGTYAASEDGRFSVGDLQSTLMAGPEDAMRAESPYFDWLRQARRYLIDGGRLILSDEQGNHLLVFRKR